jgi:hypothetical protein
MWVFHDKDNEGTILNVLAWPQNVLTILNEGIVHLLYSKCNPFMVDGGIVCNMA